MSLYIDIANESVLPGPRSLAYIDCKGGKLTINNPSAILTFPPDALLFGVIKEISLCISWSEDYPPIKDDQMVLGPVVQCFPDGMTFQKNVFLDLTLPCGMLDLTLKSIEVWCREKADGMLRENIFCLLPCKNTESVSCLFNGEEKSIHFLLPIYIHADNGVVGQCHVVSVWLSQENHKYVLHIAVQISNMYSLF